MAEILVGRKAICNYLQVSWSTVKNWIKTRDFPVLQETGRQPILMVDAMIKWETERRESLKKR